MEKKKYKNENNRKIIEYFAENPQEFFAETISALTLNHEAALNNIKNKFPITFDKAIKIYKEYMGNE